MGTRRDAYLEGIMNFLVSTTVVVGWVVGLGALSLAASEFLGSIPEVQEFLSWVLG